MNHKEGKNSSSSSYNSTKEKVEEKVIRKVGILLEAENTHPIITRIKSIGYLNKLHELLINQDKKKEKVKDIIGKIKRRIYDIKQNEQQEIALLIKELQGYQKNLLGVETKLENLRNSILHDAFLQDIMVLNNKETIVILEDVNNILSKEPQNINKRDLQNVVNNIESQIELQEHMLNVLKQNESKQVCSRILTPKQVGPICWFMATFVAMFYSQRSRKILVEESNDWDKRLKLFRLLKHVLDDKYLKTENRESDDYRNFSDDTFGNILTLLFKKDPNSFPYNQKLVGFYPEVYICKLYDLLGVDCEMFDYIGFSILAYSYHNTEYNLIDYKFDDETKTYSRIKKTHFDSITNTYYTKGTSTPTIVIIRTTTDHYISANIISSKEMYDELTSMREEIRYNDNEYILDSVILNNWNISNIHTIHAIAGITCEGIKYIYNGWTRKSMDPAMASQIITRDFPCELQQHDWNVKEGGDFCLNTSTCIPDILKKILHSEKRHCFNFSKGDRLLIYVRKDMA